MADYDTPKPVLDPEKKYRYTWPGLPSAVISGAALIQLCKGADPALLNIEEVVSRPSSFDKPQAYPASGESSAGPPKSSEK